MSKFIAITPAKETIAMIAGPGGDGYPIVNYEYAIVSIHQPSAARAKALKEFLTWVVTTGNGSSFLGQVGFQPLSPDITDPLGAADREDPVMARTASTTVDRPAAGRHATEAPRTRRVSASLAWPPPRGRPRPSRR